MAHIARGDREQVSSDLLATLLASVRALATSRDEQAGFDDLVRAACASTGADAGALWRRDPRSDELTLSVPAQTPVLRLRVGAGLAGRCAQAASVLHTPIRDATGDFPDLTLLGADGTTAVLCLPLTGVDGRVLGVLELLHTRCDHFAACTVLPAQILATQAALAFQRVAPDATGDTPGGLRTEVEVARDIQRGTLPTVMPVVPGYDLHGHFQPATYAGGDMFDLVQLQQGVFLLLGDATGHGFGPALSATEMQGMLRVAFRLGADLDQAYLHVNNQLEEDLAADRFLTAFMGFLDPATHIVRYHAAGQGPLLHFHAADERCEWRDPSTFPVGISQLEKVSAAETLQLAPGDILGLISDGLFERIDAHGAEFGVERVAGVIQQWHRLPMRELCQRLLEAADAFAGGLAAVDDVTLVFVRRLPG
ncbi:MAG: PP2C family protein-serine/threonine phosphatase [Rhodanobacteraceae bacterium]